MVFICHVLNACNVIVSFSWFVSEEEPQIFIQADCIAF